MRRYSHYEAVGERPRTDALRPRLKSTLFSLRSGRSAWIRSRAIVHLDRARAHVDEPERLELVVRRADAAIQAAACGEAVAALDEVPLLFAPVPDAALTAKVLTQLLAGLALRRSEELLVPLADEAVALLEPSGHPATSRCLTELAGVLTVRERTSRRWSSRIARWRSRTSSVLERSGRLLGLRFTARLPRRPGRPPGHGRGLRAPRRKRRLTLRDGGALQSCACDLAFRRAEDARRVRGRARIRPEPRRRSCPRGSPSERSPSPRGSGSVRRGRQARRGSPRRSWPQATVHYGGLAQLGSPLRAKQGGSEW